MVFFYPVKIFGFIEMPGDSSHSMPFNVQRNYPTIKNDASPSFEQNNIKDNPSVLENNINDPAVNGRSGDNNEPNPVKPASISFWVIVVILSAALIFLVFIIFSKKIVKKY